MIKIRLIFVKQFASRRKVSHKQVFFRNDIDQKIIISTVLLLWNKMVQSSLKWLLESSRRDKRLAWLFQGQLQTRLRFWSKLEIKRIHNALLCGAFCDINKSLTKLVSNYTLNFCPQSVSKSISQQASQLVSQSFSMSISQSVSHQRVGQSIIQPVNLSVSPAVSQ